jgi:DNA-binding CsgD family transcriptional regulator/tetratricopeptide (TPR) repeat protein
VRRWSTTLRGRRDECAELDRFVERVRAGESGALVLHGEAGIGKTALLRHLAQHALGCRIANVTGIQGEMELPFAGLHQLCGPRLDRLERLPAPQRDALRTVFGITTGAAPDRFLIGLAVLGLLSDAADDQPLLCLVDDYQWLDRATAQILTFVARRLGSESLGLVLAVRDPGEELAGLPDLAVKGLPDAEAGALLDSALTASLDRRVRDQIIAETRGNPLALLELPLGHTAAELAGGFAIPGAADPTDSIEGSFRRRYDGLPPATRRLVLVAAADPTGDPSLVWRAAGRLDVGTDVPAVADGLVELGGRVRFRHPLARSAAYWSASPEERRQAHLALAEETDPDLDPDRRSWHLAQAAPGPDDEVAAELENSANRARARGGSAAAAAFLERAAALTLDPKLRAERALAAAVAEFQAGAFDAAMELLAMAERGPLGEHHRARVDLVRAQLAFVLSRGGEAPLLLLKAARRLEAVDPGLARDTYLDAFTAASFAGRAASPGGGVVDVARAAVAAPLPEQQPSATDHLLAGLAGNYLEGYAAGVPGLRSALAEFGTGRSPDHELRWLWLMTSAALHLWDDEHWFRLSGRYLELARTLGALSELPLAISTRAMMLLFAGELDVAAALVDEQQVVTEATGSQLASYSGMYLAAMRGRKDLTEALINTTNRDAPGSGEGISVAVAEWTRAVLHNGLGNYADAMAAAEKALDQQEYPQLRYPGVANWAAVELIEAATHCGAERVAVEATEWITEATAASGTGWALGVDSRSRALVAAAHGAEGLFRESLRFFGTTRVRSEQARTHLLYGEWLRRQRRRTDAREQLRIAHSMLESMGMRAFADRARHELLATGETARRRSLPITNDLTSQEELIARLARDGMTNPEIASRLFISARTVQYHLRKVFAKLDIASRSQLDRVLPKQE